MTALESGFELFRRDSSLLQDADQRSAFQLAMIRHDASRRSATQNDMTAALPRNRKAQTFQCAHD
ncbi:MAG TPA: hypothetical protein VJ696_00320, partial [Rhodanobacteraceae bacterium]|nr:hypothetical protein [Rhodanobacteraceae bacterium]